MEAFLLCQPTCKVKKDFWYSNFLVFWYSLVMQNQCNLENCDSDLSKILVLYEVGNTEQNDFNSLSEM